LTETELKIESYIVKVTETRSLGMTPRVGLTRGAVPAAAGGLRRIAAERLQREACGVLAGNPDRGRSRRAGQTGEQDETEDG
jgi:hypothetical protein